MSRGAGSSRKVSVLDLAKMWRLLAGFEGERVSRVAQSGDVFLLRFRRGALVFSAARGVAPCVEECTLPGSWEKPRWAGEVEGRRVEAVEQVSGDRVVAFELGPRRLVLEWVREGNLLLLDGGGRILRALRQREMRDRALKPGHQYVPPPRVGDAFSDDPGYLYAKLGEYSGRAAVTAVSLVASLPAELVYEAMYRLGLDPSAKARALGEDAFRRVLSKSVEIFEEALADPDRGFRVSGEVYAFNPEHLGAGAEEVSFAREFPAYVLGLIKRDLQPEEGAGAQEAIRRAVEELSRKAELLSRHSATVDEVLAAYRGLVASRLQWSLVEARLKEAYPIVKSVDPARSRLVLELEGVEVEVDASRSALSNAASYFEKAKSAKRKLAEASAAVERSAEPAPARPAKPAAWYAQFRFFFTSNGFLVVAGRSAGQNELLVRRYMEPGDIFLHADIHGAAAVVLKTGGKQPGEADIAEAAQFAACFSSAWKGGLYAVDVFWVPAEQVSKKPPSGEYLAKGSFMVYGKKNYVRGVKLELLVGLCPGGELCVLPALANPRGGCFLKVTPGVYRKDLAARKIAEFVRRECGAKVGEDEVARLLPDGGFHLERWRPWPGST
ncbi:ribosome rescue protein RqcH [Thermofilum pendens]|uniref:NFACT RNA-binding domain-containing protein n=1 Tax=Thermofilum pendens (strain DSM 2475 / Hrk 5) TaxID=368408 RepID=A1RY67_THEPD|nr:ribosome rescue protein RqcH [Thermofilum pendens]ABL78147.1 protein of unknown function DUF814 [Thermofilum pendens Hrk 5]